MIEKLKELVNEEPMIKENSSAELKIGKIIISAEVIEGNKIEKVRESIR